jgi:hypothetical protein
VNPYDKPRIRTYRAERKESYDDLSYERERELCERERAKANGNNGNGAPEKFCYCRELIVNGRRVPCPPLHDCSYVARRSALVNEAAGLATEKCGDPSGRQREGTPMDSGIR